MAGGFPYYMYMEQEVDDPNGLFVEDQPEHSDEDESERESDYEDEDDSNEDEEDEVYVPSPPPPRPRVLPASENVGEEIGDCKRRTEGAQTSSSQGDGIGANGSGGECCRSEIDGLFCPICMEAWSNGGDHQVCCLPCGHLYGASCIKKWLQQRKNSGKCPQCNRKCTLKDVRVIYASQIVVIDHQLQKKVQSLEAKCTSFEKKDEDWHKKEVKWRRREVDLHLQVHQLTKRTSYLERLLGDAQNRPSGLFSGSQGSQEQAMFGHDLDFGFGGQGSSSNFVLQQELQVDGAKFFDVDASSQIFIIARRLSGMGGMHVLTKMSLIAPHEREDIGLPVSTKAVRDLRVAPHGRLALLASLGKKLSVISTESNNVVLSYDLPAAAWSCSWDLNSSHYIYSGLQNGMLLVFDMRQTLKPMESLTGLTCNPIHTVHSLSPDSTLPSGARSLLTASSIGLCQWNFGGVEEGPFLVPESENQGVCIGLAYCPSNNHIVASFRPKVEMSNDMAVSQPSLTAASSLMGQGIQGSNILFKSLGNRRFQKLGSTYMTVNDIRLPKSAIVDRQNHNPQFAYGSEVACELVLQELPSFMNVQRLKTQKHPIRDVKYTHDLSSGLLSCLSEDILQLFSSKTL